MISVRVIFHCFVSAVLTCCSERRQRRRRGLFILPQQTRTSIPRDTVQVHRAEIDFGTFRAFRDACERKPAVSASVWRSESALGRLLVRCSCVAQLHITNYILSQSLLYTLCTARQKIDKNKPNSASNCKYVRCKQLFSSMCGMPYKKIHIWLLK